MLSPKEAFELLEKLIGEPIEKIVKPMNEPLLVKVYLLSYLSPHIIPARIDWGEDTVYRPQRWRKVTRQDVADAIMGKEVVARTAEHHNPVKLVGWRGEEGWVIYSNPKCTYATHSNAPSKIEVLDQA